MMTIPEFYTNNFIRAREVEEHACAFGDWTQLCLDENWGCSVLGKVRHRGCCLRQRRPGPGETPHRRSVLGILKVLAQHTTQGLEKHERHATQDVILCHSEQLYL